MDDSFYYPLHYHQQYISDSIIATDNLTSDKIESYQMSSMR